MEIIPLKELTIGLAGLLVVLVSLFYNLIRSTWHKEKKEQKIINDNFVLENKDISKQLIQLNLNLVKLESVIENLKDKILNELNNDIKHEIEQAKNHIEINTKNTVQTALRALDIQYDKVEVKGNYLISEIDSKLTRLKQ